MAGNFAAINSKFEALSTQVAASMATPKVEITNLPIPPMALAANPGASNTSGALFSVPSQVLSFPPLPPQLNHSAYPNVPNWDEETYLVNRKSGNQDDEVEIQGSVLSSYMEDEHGNPIPKATRSAVCKKAMSGPLYPNCSQRKGDSLSPD